MNDNTSQYDRSSFHIYHLDTAACQLGSVIHKDIILIRLMSTEPLHASNKVNKSNSSYTDVVPSDAREDDERSQYKEQVPTAYREYNYRWVVFAALLASIAINGMAYETCIPIAKEIKAIYGVSDQVISLTATLYMLMHPILSFPASQVIVKNGFAQSVNIGSALTLAGLGVRLLVNQTFYSVLMGSILCGIGRPFILNGQATMAQNWFTPKQRTLVLTICNMVQTLSIVLSLMVPGKIVFANYKATDDGNQYTFNLMLYEFIAGAILLPTFFIIKSTPPTPPSAYANTDVVVPFKLALKGIFSNVNFLMAFSTNSIYFGTLKGFGVIMPYLLNPYNFDSGVIALTGSMPIIGGMVSSLFISSIVLRVGKYKPITLVLMFCSVALSAVFYVALLTESTVWVYINTFMLGFFLIPLIPVMIELSCELVYPISSSFAVGTLFSGSTLFTVLSSQVLTLIVKGTDSDKTSVLVGTICIVVILILGFIVQLFVKETRNRQKEIIERKKQSTLFFQSEFKSGIGASHIIKGLGQQQSALVSYQQSVTSRSIGDLPTYYPFVDPRSMLTDPEVFNPEVVMAIQRSVVKMSQA